MEVVYPEGSLQRHADDRAADIEVRLLVRHIVLQTDDRTLGIVSGKSWDLQLSKVLAFVTFCSGSNAQCC